ncbi:FKBP-type peptidyl-prolyl cis-trans isomerase [Rarobacter incanus]|uniref:peptidylprolyl isomerase n=1 Tax=Rarobacter incanus TaxID=153494 RepID=A0A542SLX3_9MICO|nr:FKBP-type peptidyl-prolyl cis-trans isomerase [Rarobacter incanus]TQK75636.1 peptidylprolyl isomerase [Rarobacter incanus]
MNGDRHAGSGEGAAKAAGGRGAANFARRGPAARAVRAVIAAVTAGALAVAVAGCGWTGPKRTQPKPSKSTETATPDKDVDVLEHVQVTGTWDTKPDVAFTPPVSITKTERKTLIEGAGGKLRPNGKALLRILAISGSTGDELRNDFDTLPQVYRVTVTDLGEALYESLVGIRAGGRVSIATYDEIPLIMVVDVLPINADGTKVADPATESSDGEKLPTVDGTNITIPKKSDPPSVLTTSVLIRGNGAQVAAGKGAVIQYEAVRWSNGKVVGSSRADDALPVTVNVGSDALIEGLDSALSDVTVGSRILVVVPPGQAFGLTDGKWKKETMVYLIDVLAASAQGEGSSSGKADDAAGGASDTKTDTKSKSEKKTKKGES